MNQSLWLTAVIFLPLVGAVLIGFAPVRWARQLALGASLATWVVSLLVAANLNAGAPAGAFQLTETREWIPAFGIQYKLGIDGLSLALVVLTTTLSWVSILASFGPIQVRVKEYMISFLILEVGMTGVFLALDTFVFYIFWEVVLVPMYLIIGIWGGSNRIYATIKFVLYTLVGSLLMLVAILATAFAYQGAHAGAWTGAFDYEALRAYAGTTGFADGLQLLAFAAFFLAFAIKVPMFPFHTWLPDAHVEAPTAGSVLLAGVLLKMGTYGLVRFNLPLFPHISHLFAPLISLLAIVGIIYGALVAMVQPDIKKLVAYSSVSHLGFVVLGIFSFTIQGLDGAIYQMLNHGVSTGALFLLVGIIYDRRHTRLIEEFGGLSNRMPVYAAFFLIVTLSLIGLPGLNGFVGEFLVLLGAFGVNQSRAAFAAVGVVLSAIYMLWMYQRVMWGRLENDRNAGLPDLAGREHAMLVPILVMIFWMGMYSGYFLRPMDASVMKLMNQTQAGRVEYARGLTK